MKLFFTLIILSGTASAVSFREKKELTDKHQKVYQDKIRMIAGDYENHSNVPEFNIKTKIKSEGHLDRLRAKLSGHSGTLTP